MEEQIEEIESEISSKVSPEIWIKIKTTFTHAHEVTFETAKQRQIDKFDGLLVKKNGLNADQVSDNKVDTTRYNYDFVVMCIK